MATTTHDEPVDSLGLRADADRALSRRGVLALIGGLGIAGGLAACGQAGSASPSTAATAAGATASATPLVEIPDETNGPYPADGTNGVDVLDDTGIVRTDLRTSTTTGTTAGGVPLQATLVVRDASTGDAVVGAAVYAWHCDREGRYSLYSSGVEDEDYLRGVQVTDATGAVTFTTIYPACYTGRWPHIHFEVYGSVEEATGGGTPLKTSQLALPKETSEAVYATDGYSASVSNLAALSLTSDNVFGDDGGIHQLATMSGDVSSGYRASLTAPI